jgi:hypothetical protein
MDNLFTADYSEFELVNKNQTFFLNENGEVVIANLGLLWKVTGIFLISSIMLSKFLFVYFFFVENQS